MLGYNETQQDTIMVAPLLCLRNRGYSFEFPSIVRLSLSLTILHMLVLYGDPLDFSK